MRFEAWPEILAEEIQKASDQRFVWGQCDCALWAANVVLAMTGTDYAEEFRGKYKSAKGSVQVLKRIGEVTLSATLTEKLTPINCLLKTQRGDVVTKEFDGAQALGICIGSKVAFKARVGLSFYPLSECELSWRAV